MEFNSAAIQAELVSTIWPIKISSPMVIISHEIIEANVQPVHLPNSITPNKY
jgi:hypothetical protein